MLQTRISTKTDKDGFSPAVFRSKLEQKIPVTECYSDVFVLLSNAKSMGSCVRFCCYNISFLRIVCGEGSLSQCSRVSLL